MSLWDLHEFRPLYIEGSSKMPKEVNRRRGGDSDRPGQIPQGRFHPYERPRSETDTRPVTDEQAENARERLAQVLTNSVQRANSPRAEAGKVEEKEAEELFDLLMTIDQHRQQSIDQSLEEGRQKWQEWQARQERRRLRRRQRPDPASSLRSIPALRRELPIVQQQLQEPPLPPLLADSTTDATLDPTPSADEQLTWEFEDWFDGDYLDQLISNYLHPEGQELVEEVTRAVEQLSLASNLAREVAGVDEQPALTQDPTVSSETPMVNGNVPTASGSKEEPNGEGQGGGNQLPK
ncbi:hypothetical protein NCS52_00856500 [Fusarium sp. LHS14.1]|nr:hypothetical protein NCS52_00856500 [Fusarium sp. LHS14.1]